MRHSVLALLLLLAAPAGACVGGGGDEAGGDLPVENAADESAGASAGEEATVEDRAAKERLARAHRELGLALEADGDLPGAVREFEAALAAAPWVAGPEGGIEETPFADLARICLGGGWPEAVKRACTAVIPSGRLPPEELAALIARRAEARLALGEVEGARSDLDAALEIETSHPGALLARGRILAAEGDEQAAIADFGRVVRLGGPLAPEARLERASLLLRTGEVAKAVEDYDAIIADAAASDRHAAAWRGRATADCLLGQADAAAVGWQVWAQLAPEGAGYLDELLRARGYRRGPAEADIGPLTLAALRAWTREGCPGAAAGG